MKTLYCYLLLIVLLFAYSCQGDNNTTDLVQLIPFPNKIEIGRDSLDISSGFKLNFAEVTPGTESNAKSEIESNLTEYLGSTALNISDSGVEVKVSLNTNYANDSQLLNSSNKANESKKSSETQKRHDTNISNYSNSSDNPNSSMISYFPDESYTLSVNEKGIEIGAMSEAGLFYAIQTLIQLTEQNPGKLPFIEIEDSPRFAYRGMHFDVSRHFFSLDFLKKQIDMMAHYKLNYFHWHLTDGPGWRIEIKQYPELTDIASWRTHSLWKEWWASERKYAKKGYLNPYGGYYTQEEARELVEYAAERHITIIPEIEMPGHSEEVLAV